MRRLAASHRRSASCAFACFWINCWVGYLTASLGTSERRRQISSTIFSGWIAGEPSMHDAERGNDEKQRKKKISNENSHVVFVFQEVIF